MSVVTPPRIDSREEYSDDGDYDKSSKNLRRRGDVLGSIVALVENVIPNLLKLPAVRETSRSEKQTSRWLRR